MKILFCGLCAFALMFSANAAGQFRSTPGVELLVGTVVDVQTGQVSRDTRDTYTTTGSVVGAAAGGLAGYALTRKARGSTRAVVGTLSALLGGVAGRSVEGRQRLATIVVVRLDNGRVLALPAPRVPLHRGERVGVGQSGYGRRGEAIIVPLSAQVAQGGAR